MNTVAKFALACSANTLRFADLTTRVAAAAAGGFTGLGLRVADYVDSAMDDATIRDLLAENGLQTLELEHTWDWAADKPHPIEAAMFRFADRIGVRQLNVPMFAAHPLGDLAGPFGALCDRAADHGLLVGFEFLPYSHVRTIRDAWEVVASADRPNGGLVIDFWHWRRSAATLSDLSDIPASRIISLQLCEARTQTMPDLAHEARHHRELPGAGVGADGQTAALVRGLADRGISCPVSVEVFSDALDAQPARQAAATAAAAGAHVLAEADWAPVAWTINQHRSTR
jgi:sugar phosphate isomerase/epimerase